MSRSLWIAVLLGLLVLPGMAQAQQQAGNWALSLSGAGTNDQDFDNGGFQFNGELGYFFTKEIEVSVRQSVGYADDANNSSDWNFQTSVAADYHFNLGNWQPFLGASIGYFWGDSVSDSWYVGIEGGVKYFVNKTTFIFGRVEYDWLLDSDDSANDGFEDGMFVYSLGIGFLM